MKILSIFVAFLENMNFTQLASINDFYYFFREKSKLHTSYEKILQPWDSNQTMCEKSDPALFCRKA